MGSDYLDRMLIADGNPEAAREFRAAAEKRMEVERQIYDAHVASGFAITPEIRQPYEDARREVGQLNRICLRHAAVGADRAIRLEGGHSDLESAVIHFEVTNPA